MPASTPAAQNVSALVSALVANPRQAARAIWALANDVQHAPAYTAEQLRNVATFIESGRADLAINVLSKLLDY